MKYISYLRCSTKRQGESQLGLEAQRQIIAHFYPQVEKEFLEVRSGKNVSERPVLKQAIEYCLKNDCTLVVGKIDRLSRNVDDTRAILKQLNGNLRSCDLPGEIDLFTLTLFAAFAERERTLISIRTKAALKVRKETKGQWQYPKTVIAPVETENGIKFVPISEISAQSRKARALSDQNNIRASSVIKIMVRNTAIPLIVKHLNDNGFKTSTGGNFSYAQVQRLAAL